MKRCIGVTLVGVFSLIALDGGIRAQTVQQNPVDWPNWAYGYLTPLRPGDRVAPPCPSTTTDPRVCRAQTGPVPAAELYPDDESKRTLQDTAASFTRDEAYYEYGPADWYPGDHPPMPEIVANGKESAGVRACALCHYPNGQGKMENAPVAGLPAEYILQQLDAFGRGERRNADPRKANTNEMAVYPHGLTDAEKNEIAEYFSSMPFRPWVRVVEAEEAPQVIADGGLMVPIPGAPPIPLGQRIIEVPEYPERTVMTRDPRGGFIAYVPVGSLAKGEELVTMGAGKTIQCGLCHGPELRGIAAIPGIAGRSTSYMMRQMWDFKQGTRVSPFMGPVTANLNAEDMLNIVAYVASLTP